MLNAGLLIKLLVPAVADIGGSPTTTGFLDDGWRDVLAVGGAAGVLLTLVGLGIAIWQLYKTQSATAAATAAAVKAMNDSRQQYEKYVIGQANRLLSEAKQHVQSSQWQLAAVRLDDMAENVMQFAAFDEQWEEAVAVIREFSVQFGRVANDELQPQGVQRKWHKSLAILSNKLGQHHGPFLSVQQEQNDDTK